MTESATLPAPTRAADAGGHAPKSPRVVFVDLLRLLAALQMVNGHTLAAVLDPALQRGPFFDRYNAMRGMVSVAFLLASGMAYHLSTLHRFEAHRGEPSRSRRRMRIALIVIAIGYLLGFPWGAWNADPDVRAQSWYYFLRVGILQCIGFGLLSLELMTVLARRRWMVVTACGLLALLSIGVAPWCDELIPDHRPHALWNWLSTRGGSIFPLVPFLGFMFAGVAVGAYVLPDAGRTPLWVRVRRLAVVTLVATATWAIAVGSTVSLHDPAIHHPSTAPALSLRNVALVMALLLVLAAVSYRITRLPRLLAILASETLFIFTFHIVVLFFPLIRISRHLGNGLTLLEALGASAGMVVLTGASTLTWHRIRACRREEGAARGVRGDARAS